MNDNITQALEYFSYLPQFKPNPFDEVYFKDLELEFPKLSLVKEARMFVAYVIDQSMDDNSDPSESSHSSMRYRARFKAWLEKASIRQG
jgi:hypothetical protein